MTTFDKPRMTVKIQLAGKLTASRAAVVNDTAVFTYYSVPGRPHQQLLCMVRPGVQHMLDKLCSREHDLHICDVAVCTAAKPGYTRAVCRILDPCQRHLLQPNDHMYARIHAEQYHKQLERVTAIPKAALIMDDCPDRPGAHGTVWNVASQRVRIPMQEYIPGCDQADMVFCEQLIRKVHTKVCRLSSWAVDMPCPWCLKVLSAVCYFVMSAKLSPILVVIFFAILEHVKCHAARHFPHV